MRTLTHFNCPREIYLPFSYYKIIKINKLGDLLQVEDVRAPKLFFNSINTQHSDKEGKLGPIRKETGQERLSSYDPSARLGRGSHRTGEKRWE
jgi:hypothetical protein